MGRRTKLVPATPAAGSFWGFDDAALARAEAAYRAWLDTGEQIQRQAVDYLSGRIAKDSALLAELAKCGTALELLDVQTGYARDALGDFIENGRRIATLVEDAARKHLPGGTQ